MDFKHALKDLLPDAPTVVLSTPAGPELRGRLNPDGVGVEDVIGFKFPSFAGYPGRNVVGPRATGDNVNLTDDTGTVFLGPKILGADPDPDQRNDIAVCSAVEGAAAALLKIGREKGIIPPAGTGKGQGGSTGEVVAKPAPEGDGSQEAMRIVQANLEGIVSDIAKTAPKTGGGVYARKLREIRSRLNWVLSETAGDQ